MFVAALLLTTMKGMPAQAAHQQMHPQSCLSNQIGAVSHACSKVLATGCACCSCCWQCKQLEPVGCNNRCCARQCVRTIQDGMSRHLVPHVVSKKVGVKGCSILQNRPCYTQLTLYQPQTSVFVFYQS